MFAAGTAAADRTMVVLLDATGSMQTTRCDNSLSRFDQSKLDAADRVTFAAMETGGLSGVAVFKFSGSGTGIVAETAGFVTPFDAVTAINNATVTSDLTPLANAMCSVIDTARASGSGATTTRFLEVFSDGGENNSVGAPCAGPYSTTNSPPFDAGPPASWQNLVYERTTNPLPAVTVDATLYHNETGCPLLAARIDPETAALTAAGRQAPALSAPATDVDFFSALATATGGNFTDVVDSAPVPVIADLDGNFVVDRNDAILLARLRRLSATTQAIRRR
ncbi:MAG: hypothetical protein E6J91_39145 [Deltaproteobacteria bacterium]|nr:MAG: hypothetical protein E6J91_39145 [Deltaproteobacteria bacterium]